MTRQGKQTKQIIYIIVPLVLFLILALAGFQYLEFPRLGDISASVMKTIGFQALNSQALANDTLVLKYITNDANTKAQAIGDMEVSLQQFEEGQAVMEKYRNVDLKQVIQQSDADYLLIDASAKTILTHINNGSPDNDQTGIILSHSHSYRITMSIAAQTTQQIIDNITFQFFAIRVVIDVIIAMFVLYLGYIAIKGISMPIVDTTTCTSYPR